MAIFSCGIYCQAIFHSYTTVIHSTVSKLQNLLPGMFQLVMTRKCNHEDKSAITIKGTRAFHYFKPVGATRLGMKRISDDKQFSLETDIISSREDIPSQNTNIGQYVSALYDDNWYLGIVQHIDKTNKDVFLQ